MPRFSGTPVAQSNAKPRFSGTLANAPQQTAPDPGLALPGTQSAPQAQQPTDYGAMAMAALKANPLVGPIISAAPAIQRTLGLGGGQNPMDALATMGESTIGSVPVAGPALHDLGEKARAWVGQNVYGDKTATPESMAAADAARNVSYPEAQTAGRVLGPVGVFSLASMAPFGATALGLEGGLASRMGFGLTSQYGVNVGDEMAHGKSLPDAAMSSIIPTAEAAPFLLFGGKAPKAGVPPAASERLQAVNTLLNENVPLSAGQQTGSKWLQYRESELGGAKADTLQEQQKQAFVQAALKRAGVDAPRATPQVLSDATKTLGKHFDALAYVSKVPVDAKLQNDLLGIVSDYHDNAAAIAPVVEKTMNRIGELAAQNGGFIKGRAYQNLNEHIGKAMKGADSAATTMALGNMKEALDDAMERGMSGSTKAAWQLTRQRYGNLQDVVRAVNGARAEDAGVGLFSPANLATSMKGFSRKGYALGKGDLNDLAHAGTAVMAPLPNSGTAQRLAAQSLVSLPTMLAGGLAGHDSAGIPGAIAGALAGTVLPYAAGRMVLSNAGKSVLTGKSVLSDMQRSILPNLVGRSLVAQ